ncbi:MAG: hypothetical protein QM788_18560 [Roseateles sp.]|uniref:hypothetical protein n=1 Tax=Roseateles sp. TaxID=1971397 RepID=UPI0039EA03F9
MTVPHPAAGHALQRWQRMALGVRLAYHPSRPCSIGCYVGVGRALVRHGFLPELEAEQRMYRLLLQTAADLALPPAWRQHCLSHALHPLARLTTLLAHDPFTVTALHARWDLAHRQLPTTPADAD